MQSSKFLIKKLCDIESNPYIIYQFITQEKGPEFFKDVFEKQAPHYDIDYRAVNKMLMVTKAYEREYSVYKEHMEKQMFDLVAQLQINKAEIYA